MLEIIDRDAGARISKWTVGKHTITLPNICVVVNPNKLSVPVKDLKNDFHAEILITNSYIINKNEKSREQAKVGLHKMLGWDGPIYTDSGTFQMYSQGLKDLDNKSVLELQKKLGSDIITPVDLFTLPSDDEKTAKQKLVETVKRVKESRKIVGDRFLVGPIQGGRFTNLRAVAAKEIAKAEPDVFAIGGIVPLMEQYRFKELIDIVATCKENLPADKPIHAFGAGHPMTFALLAAFGADLFDSAMYSIAAERGAYLTVSGTHQLSDLKEFPCSCPQCVKAIPQDILKMDERKRVEWLARHNLYVTFEELRTVRQAIRGNWLWELVQERVRAHPNLLEALQYNLEKHAALLQKLDPVSKKSALMWSGSETEKRPEVSRAKESAKKVKTRSTFSKHPFGKIPSGLKWMYPFSQSITLDGERTKAKPKEVLENTLDYQFGKGASKTFKRVTVEVSKNTGRPKHVWSSKKVLLGTFRPHDGFFLPTMEGANLLRKFMKKVEVPDAEPAKFVSEGRQVFAKFAKPAKNILPGEEVAVFHKNKIIAVGQALLNSEEMSQMKRGIAVVTRAHA